MEPIKKRRNSILKKKTTEEDTTTEIKARRISFSGKKSVKEFIAGEEAETIWGTSYEESADDLKVSSSESGLVNVHVKRIQLRNRRVVCEPQQQKRRSSLKRKVLIAQNDKENLCVIPNPPPVEIEQEVKPPTLPTVIIEPPQSKSPVESELAMVRSQQNVSKSLETMPQKKLVVDCSSICSSTFDFINLSAKINKTITIENSLDVSLKESELQMFKFLVPVRATEISPNTSNILCRSIQMSEEDKNILKMVRKQKVEKNIAKEKITDEEFNLIETKNSDVAITDMSKTNFEETLQQSGITAAISSNSIEVPQNHDGKGSKRKSERTSQSFVLDLTSVDMNSPLRKKPMHTLYGSSMDVTNNIIENISQMEPNGRSTIYEPVAIDESISKKQSGRPTIHFDSVVVEESAVGMHSLSGTNTPSHTIYDSKTINESSSFPNTTASCLAMGNQTDAFSIEISMTAPNENTQTQDIRMEYTHMNGNGLQTQPLSIPKNSQTIYESSDVEEITEPTNQLTKATKNQRESIYTSIYMDEESPKSSRTLNANNTKGLKLRQTILTPEGIIEDIPRDVEPPKCVLQKTITTTINIFEDSIQVDPDTKRIKTNRPTIYDAVEIKEDITLSQEVNVYLKKNKGKRVSDYNPTDMIEESPRANENKIASVIGLEKRQTIFNPEDIVEDISTNLSSKISLKQGMSSKPSTKNRQTVYETVDIELDAVSLEKNKPRQSIYTPSDMIEDSPKTIQPEAKGIVSSDNIKPRNTIFTPTDMIEDLTREFPSQDAFQRTIEESVYMLEDSVRADPVSKTISNNDSFEIEEPVGNVLRIGPTKSYQLTESVYSPTEMLEESLKPAPSHSPGVSQVPNTLKCRQTILTPENIVDDAIDENEAQDVLQKTTKTPINIFEDSLNSEPVSKTSTIENCQTKREKSSINSADIEVVTEPIQNVDRSSKINKSRESIYTPSDMIEDSPKPTRTIKTESKLGDLKTNHTICTPEDVVEDLPNEFASRSLLQRTNKSSLNIFAEPATEQIPKSRQTIYDSADIEEVTVPIQQPIFKSNTSSASIIKNRKTIYDTVDIEQATESIKPGFVWNKSNMSMASTHTTQGVVEEFPICSKFQKQPTSSKPIFTHEEILEDTINENQTENFLQNTIKTPVNIFEDSLQEEPALKEVVKDRQTIYEIADIVEEDYANIQPGRSVSLIRKPRKSINIPREIIPDDLEETNTKSKDSRATSNVKRHTTFNQVDISLDSATVPQISAEDEDKKNQNPRKTIYEPSDIVEDLPKAIKERAPSKIQVFRRELSSTDLTAKQPLQLQARKIQQNIVVHSNQLQIQCAAKTPQFSYAVHEGNLKKRQSIHTPVDMVEDSPKPVKTIQSSTSNTILRKTVYEPCDIATESPLNPIQTTKSNTILRKTVYEPCDIATESPKPTPVEKMHQITVENQTDIIIDSTVTTTDKFSQKNNRQTVHTHLDMMEDSPKQKGDGMGVELEENEIRQDENKLSQQETDVEIEKRIDMPFRKPTKLFSETYKSLEKPYSSTKSLMDKVMQDMGYSMNFQFDFHPEAAAQKLSPPNSEFPSMNFSVAQDVNKEAVSADNSMELTIDNEAHSNKPKQQTMYLSEGIEVEVGNDNHIQSKTSQFYKTSFDETLQQSSKQLSFQATEHQSRKTILMNQDLDLCEIDDSQNIPPPIPSQDLIKTNRRTNHLNEDLDVDERKEIGSQVIRQIPIRQTIYFNQDLDFSKIDDLQMVPQGDSIKINQRIDHLNQDLDIDDRRKIGTELIPQRVNRETIQFHEDIEGDDHQQLDMSIVSGEQLISPKRVANSHQSYEESGRRTINFQQEVDIEDKENIHQKSITKQQLTPDQNRNKHALHQELQSDDEYAQQKKLFNETKKNTEENACRLALTDKSDLYQKSVYFNNKPEFTSTQNRQTVHFTHNNSLDESFQPVVDEKTINPSIANRNSCLKEEKEVTAKLVSMPKRVTICDVQPLDMDESLLPKSTARKTSFSRTLNFDEIPTMRNETSHQKSKVTLQSASSKDDESPIFNPRLRPKVPMTPSEGDRSLAEYLKLEAAIDDDHEEEIFYDAEDGTETDKQNKRQTCHVPVNIFEESGMQRLQSRQTTFSPKEMTNDSLDQGQSKLEAKEANTEFTILSKETHQNASHNQMHKQTLDKSHKGLFQKTIEPNDMMEVTQMRNSTKPILMEPRLGGINFDVQKNRQTLHFNESINITDVSTAWKPISSVQSVKELLLENARLFSQSNLLKPSPFENKRSTLFFTGNDDAMDVSCIESGPADPESTPTKNKISRIPQLIGSAKKLESLKKSMEFIQQELPNIGCHLRNNEPYDNIDESLKDEETPRRFSSTIPKKLQELEESFDDAIKVPQKPISSTTDKTVEEEQNLVRQLHESFDTIDIPRKVLSSVRKTIEESIPQREAGEKEEMPRRTFNVNPIELQESFDIVDIPRRGTTFQRNDTLYICPNEKEMTINASQKSLFQLEEPPITISDVSTFFSQKLPTYSPNTTETLYKSNVNENEIQALSRSPDSEDTTHNLAHFQKRYVELTCDSISLSNSKDNIEKTHLSLVNTFDDESEMVQSLPKTQMAVEIISPSPVKVQPLKPKSSVCRKCKCQRLSVTQNDTTIGSFMLEPLPVYKIDFSVFEELAKQPSISDVGNFLRQKMRESESESFNVSDGSQSVVMADEDLESIENLLKELAEMRLANTQYRQQKRKEVKIENSFRYKVRRKIQSNSKWMINDLLLYNNVIVLTNTCIRTFTIVIYFTPKDPRGVDVIFNDIQFKPNRLHPRQWKPFEYALHYQLLVELPFDLKTICPTSEHFFDFFDHLEKVTEDVLKTGKEMLSLILPSPASLIREPSGRLYIRKYVRTKTPQNDVKKYEIHIEVRNMKKLSYESIAMPPLYEFDENIQLLPVGNDFLIKFLDNPLKFIKT